jgi:hypothetical protein
MTNNPFGYQAQFLFGSTAANGNRSLKPMRPIQNAFHPLPHSGSSSSQGLSADESVHMTLNDRITPPIPPSSGAPCS